MLRTKPAIGRQGHTLIEALMAMTVLAVLSVGTSLLYVQSLRMYKRGNRESTNRDKAALALEHIRPLIQDAFNVEYAGSDVLVLTLPERDEKGLWVIDEDDVALVSGREVVVYLSDAEGSIEEFLLPLEDDEEEGEEDSGYRGVAGGRCVWVAERSSDTEAWGSPRMLIDGVENLTFTSAPDDELLDLVWVAITVGSDDVPGYFNRTEMTAVKMDNH